MQPIALSQLELAVSESELDPSQRVAFAFPVSSASGAAATSAVYFELVPGAHLGVHTDSAEEILLVLEGTAEALVGDERGVVSAGSLVHVPALVPHDLANVGSGRVRVLGAFASAAVVSVFEQPEQPGGDRVFVVGSPGALSAPLPQEAGTSAARGTR